MTVTDKKGPHLVYLPLPVQVDFHRCGSPYLLFGGAAGGTKSHASRWDAHLRGTTIANWRGLLLRRTYGELEGTHIDELQKEKRILGCEYNKGDYQFLYPGTGAILQLGHCDSPEAVERYLSDEFDAIYFDELVTFLERQFLQIQARARSTNPLVTLELVRGATNPGGVGSRWVRRRFIDHNITPDEDSEYDPAEWSYLPAKLEDNPYLDRRYERKLLSLPVDLRRAYRDGDWDIFPGQFFGEWRNAKHVARIEVPTDIPRICAVDWGYNRPGWCGWFVVLPDGRTYVEDEYVFSQTIAMEVARRIKQRTLERGIHVRYTVADTQMWESSGEGGESIAETFRKMGVPCQKADKARVIGWQRVRHWLADAPDEKPWLVIAPSCAYLARTLPSLVSDKHNPEDIDSEGDDHAADAVRYFVMSRPAPWLNEVRREPPVNSPAWLLARERRSQGFVLGTESVQR